MKRKLTTLSRRYETALRLHLRSPRRGLQPALALGRQAVTFGLETLELARIHEQAVATLDLTNGKAKQVERAENFFNEAISPIVATHHAAQETKAQLALLTETLNRRTLELGATNQQLKHGVNRRKNV